jgi:hypothetical protein
MRAILLGIPHILDNQKIWQSLCNLISCEGLHQAKVEPAVSWAGLLISCITAIEREQPLDGCSSNVTLAGLDRRGKLNLLLVSYMVRPH